MPLPRALGAAADLRLTGVALGGGSATTEVSVTRQSTDAVERYGLRLRYDTLAELKRQGILDRDALGP